MKTQQAELCTFRGCIRALFLIRSLKDAFPFHAASLVAQSEKNLPADSCLQETQVRSLGREDPLEKEMASIHSSILAWRISRTEEPGGLQSMGSQRVGYN